MGAALLLSISCVSYHYNLEHAYIDPKAKLSRLEIEQVLRVVTEKSRLTILAVTRRTYHGHDQVIVYTARGDPPLMDYILEKSPDGIWRIVDYGEAHVMVL